MPPQSRRAGGAECVILQIDLPDRGGERHRALAFRAVHQPEQVAGLVERFFVSPLQKNLAVGREPIKLLPQARQGNHAHAAAQLRLSEDEGQHRDEQIALRHRQQLAGVRRDSAGAASRAPGWSRTAGAPRRTRNPRCRVPFRAPDRPNSAATRAGHRRERLALHLFGRAHVQILHSLRASTASGGSVRAARRLQRQRHGKRRAFAHRALDLDIAAVGLDDSVRHRQAQPDAFALGLGGEERIEDFRQVLRRDAFAVIGDMQQHGIRRRWQWRR